MEGSEQTSDDLARQRAKAMIGRVLAGRYRLDQVIGMGAMGAVYRGEHVQLHRRVAVKVLHPDAESRPELVARFEREGLAGAHVQHPNVAAAMDFGELDDGMGFLVVELVRGRTLQELVRGGPLSVDRAVHIGRQLGAALDAVHANGMVHRDVKPRNVMVVEEQDDLVKLIDFGLAKVELDRISTIVGEPAFDIEERLSESGVVFGTIGYLAPEAAFGMDVVDARSDLYALGAILYEMLAGARPFDAEDPGQLFALHRNAPPPPFASRPGIDVPPAIEAIVMRLLAKDPDERFERATEVIAALDQALPPAAPVLYPTLRPLAPSSRAPGPSTEAMEALSLLAPGSPALAPAAVPAGLFAAGEPNEPSPSDATTTMSVPQPGAAPPAAALPFPPSGKLQATAGADDVASVPPSLRTERSPAASVGEEVGAAETPAGQASVERSARFTQRGRSYLLGLAAGVVLVAALMVRHRSTALSTPPPEPEEAVVEAPPPEPVPTNTRADFEPRPRTGPSPQVLRERLLAGVRAQAWSEGGEALVALSEAAPDAFADAEIGRAAQSVAVELARTSEAPSERVFAVLGSGLGSVGPDLLYGIVETRGTSPGAVRSAALLGEPEVMAKASAALRISFELRQEPCNAQPERLDRAAASGDIRTLVVLETLMLPCFDKPPQIVQRAIRRLRERLAR